MRRNSCESVTVARLARVASSRLGSRSGRPGSLASAAAGWVIVALLVQHALLLLQRIAEGSLLDPSVLVRWIVGLILTIVMLALRRAGVSLVRGRRAAIFWLAVLFFHVVAAAGPAAAPDSSASALLPGSAVPGLLALALLWVRSGQGTAAAVLRPNAWRLRPSDIRGLGAPSLLPLAARPPPHVCA